VKPTDISLPSLFRQGAGVLHEEHKKGEAEKAGKLRAGAGGALLADGSVVGGCHRKAFARWIGQPSSQPDPQLQSNFDAGFRNEDNWMEKLSLAWEGPIRCEEEVPVRWKTKSGVEVTGRPDMVLGDVESWENDRGFVPGLVIEHKAVVAINSAAKRWMGEVDTSHFVQTCHYSLELDCPGTLLYSAAPIGWIPYWIKKVDKDKFWPKGKGWEVKPFQKEFRVGRDESTGKHYYLNGSERVDTEITEDSIRNYYELLVDMRDSKSLYKRHGNKSHQGEVLRYNTCDYCELKDTCDEFENDFSRWTDEIMKGGN
jgi:hypothetical protein